MPSMATTIRISISVKPGRVLVRVIGSSVSTPPSVPLKPAMPAWRSASREAASAMPASAGIYPRRPGNGRRSRQLLLDQGAGRVDAPDLAAAGVGSVVVDEAAVRLGG